MPIPNPTNPGEMDYVDLSLLPKIKLENESLVILNPIEYLSIPMQLLTDPEKYDEQTVVLRAKVQDDVLDHTFELEEFEQIMARLHYEGKNERLESTSEYRQAVDTLLDTYVSNCWQQGRYPARVGVTYRRTKGIGIITDMKANQNVGTFEGLEYHIDWVVKSNTYLDILDINLTVRSVSDLLKPQRFEFVFYSLEDMMIYRMELMENAKTSTSDLGLTHLRMEQFTIKPEPWDENHDRYSVAVQADNIKSELLSVSKNDFMYSEYLTRFTASRQDILKESAEQAKKAALVSKFADIDLDL
ncbi:hypothetical protein [Alicyclobacillus shizuokensis]|uniref:hypothetical protein n=1 Tax=Alicyclobacillus shizuokensis TaxID=392014 RepID=UPI00082F43DF|nr:hypothetical protein [Alicyclobacillus shizuokensis]